MRTLVTDGPSGPSSPPVRLQAERACVRAKLSHRCGLRPCGTRGPRPLQRVAPRTPLSVGDRRAMTRGRFRQCGDELGNDIELGAKRHVIARVECTGPKPSVIDK